MLEWHLWLYEVHTSNLATPEPICTFALSLPRKKLESSRHCGAQDTSCCSALLLLKVSANNSLFRIECLELFFLLISLLWSLPTLLPLGFIAEWSITLRLKLLVFSSSAPVRHIMLPEFLPLEAPRVETAWYIDCPKMGWNQSLGPKCLADAGKSLWSQSLQNWLTVGSDLEHVAQTKSLNKQKTWFFRWVAEREREGGKENEREEKTVKGIHFVKYCDFINVCTQLFKSLGWYNFFLWFWKKVF